MSINYSESSRTRTTFEMNTPWFESPFFPTLLEQASLDSDTKKIVKAFAEDGYVIIDPEIPDFDNKASSIIQGLSNEYIEDPVRIADAWRFHPYIKELAAHQKILDLLKVLYRLDPIPFQTLNFRVGTQQRTHSDTLHFQSVPHRFMAGVWIALEDIDEDNGPLHYYPKSHKLPCYDFHDIALTSSATKKTLDLYKQYEDFVSTLMEEKKFEKKEVKIKKGQALVWAANLFHGGSPIRDTSRSRHSQVTHYYFSGCRYYTPMLSDIFLQKIFWREVTDIRTGKLVPQYYNSDSAPIPLAQRTKKRLKESIKKNFSQSSAFRRMLGKLKT